MILSKGNVSVGKQPRMALTNKASLGLFTIALIFAGCEKKPEAQSVAGRTPQPAVNQTPSAVNPQPQTKPVVTTAPEPVDETKAYYVKELDQSLSLKQINENIQSEELWPTNIYLEPPESQAAGTTADAVEKPLSSLKGIAKFVKPTSAPWRRNLRDTVRWLKVVSPQMLVAILSKSDPELPSNFLYILAGVERNSGDLLWQFQLPTDYEFDQSGPDPEWYSEPNLAVVKMGFKKHIDLQQKPVFVPQVIRAKRSGGCPFRQNREISSSTRLWLIICRSEEQT